MTMEYARLQLAIESVLEAEGGYKAPEPGDPNPTNYGVTQALYEHFLAVDPYAGVWPQTVRELDRDDAIDVYEWYLTGCSPYHDIRKIRPLVLMVMLAHCQVLMGRSAGSRVLQSAIGGITADGMIGPKTLAALDRHAPQYVVISMEDEWIAKLNRIADADSAKEKFRTGWINRASGWSGGWKP